LFIQGQLRKQLNDEGKKKKEKQKKVSKKQKVTTTISISKPITKFEPIPLDADRVTSIFSKKRGGSNKGKEKKSKTIEKKQERRKKKVDDERNQGDIQGLELGRQGQKGYTLFFYIF
jgi:hypothetical protein